MIVVADSSPLIALAKVGCLDAVRQLYSRLHISTEVYTEVVVAGAGMPGASLVANSGWIEVTPIQDSGRLIEASAQHRLGLGELSTVVLGKELRADIALMDDLRARRLAKDSGLAIRGSVGILELLYHRGYLADLRKAFQDLVANDVYIARELLDERLRDLQLPPL